MNWKEHAHLFANGKFKVKVGWEIRDYIRWASDCNYVITSKGEHSETAWKPSECTLIARPIEDMTDKEIIKQFPNTDPISLSEAVTKEPHMMFVDDFLHLISIGVYPFDQSHFADGSVIDKNSLKNTF